MLGWCCDWGWGGWEFGRLTLYAGIGTGILGILGIEEVECSKNVLNLEGDTFWDFVILMEFITAPCISLSSSVIG